MEEKKESAKISISFTDKKRRRSPSELKQENYCNDMKKEIDIEINTSNNSPVKLFLGF